MSMARPRIFTPEWAAALRDAINAPTGDREPVRAWVWPVALVMVRAPELGYPDDVAVLLELRRGECIAAKVLPAGEVTAPFIIRGDYDTWRRVVVGELDPVTAIVGNRLHLEGSLITLMANARAARTLVGRATAVPTDFPDPPPVHASSPAPTPDRA
jgi:hypothetical protein